jgi:hypothetical protein
MIEGETRMTEPSGTCHYLGTSHGPTPLIVGADEPDYGALLIFGPNAAAYRQRLQRDSYKRGGGRIGKPAPKDRCRRFFELSPYSAANLKFLSMLRQVRDRNFKFKAATQIKKLLELL